MRRWRRFKILRRIAWAKYEDGDVPKAHYKKVSITGTPDMFFDLDEVARTRRRREQPFTISELIREAPFTAA